MVAIQSLHETPLKHSFDDECKWFIWQSVHHGASKERLFKFLVHNGYHPDAVRAELGFEPKPLIVVPEPIEASKTERLYVSGDELAIPRARKIATTQAEVYTLEDFLSAEECERIIELARPRVQRSTVLGFDDGEFRTSMTAHLSTLKDPFVEAIDARICKTIGIDPSFSEGIQAQIYEVGQQFKPHTDTFEGADQQGPIAEQGQRTWTFMIYLNECEKGGGTHFPKLDRTLYPKLGTAVIWNNIGPDGTPNPDTIHAGMPVLAGTKAIITKWFRSRGRGPMVTRDENERVPAYTPTGLHKTTIPRALLARIRAFYDAAKEKYACIDDHEKHVINPSGAHLFELPDELRRDLHAELLPMCELWSGQRLDPTVVYGIRRYNRGATLGFHRDRIATHIISANLMIDQKVDQEWPLVIDDHAYREHKVVMRPGDMLLYEGARLRHGRPEPLEGDDYCDLYVHYKPMVDRA